MNNKQRILAGLMLLTVVGLCRPAIAQPPVTGAVAGSWNVATGNWTTASNWVAAPYGGSPGVPDSFNGNVDYGVIDNGGTATINTVVPQQPGGVSLGTNSGQTGILDIKSGGGLTVASNPSFPTTSDGAFRIGQGGSGTLIVEPGGSLSSVSLTLGQNSANKLTLGGTAAGTTTLNTGSVTLGATTRMTGPSINFSATGPITFQSTSTYVAEITGATQSKFKTTGAATLNGALQIDFNGFTPSSSSSWDLVDASSIVNSFTSIVPDPTVPLGVGQSFATRVVNGGTNGKLYQLYVSQKPVLSINRNTGAMSITNPGTGSFSIDGYSVASSNSALTQANWTSLATHPAVAGAGWSEANPSATRLSELRASGTSSLGAAGSWSLGNVFHEPTPASFGQNLEDVTFQYNDSTTQTTVDGVVNYTGGTGVNNLVLFVDPATGNVKMRNTSPFSVQIDGYTIASPNGSSLNSAPASWTSLQDQPANAGANWFEANLSDSRISELKSSGATTLNPNGGTTFDLGGLFKTANLKDLDFQFVLAGSSTPMEGVVLYEAAPAVTNIVGDYNHNGIVDAADYTVWRDTFGSTTDLRADGDANNSIGANDFTTWTNRFNAISGAGGGGLEGGGGTVPEPATWLLMGISGLALLAVRRRS